MSAIEIVRPGGLSIERLQLALSESKDLREIKDVRDKAKAIALYQRAQKAGRLATIDAGELILEADRRIGELSRELPRAENDGSRGNQASPKSGTAKSDALSEIGLTTQRASECERVASLPQRDFDAYKAAERSVGRSPSLGTAVELAKLPEGKREEVFAKLGDDTDIRKALREVKAESAESKTAPKARPEANKAKAETRITASLVDSWNSATDEERGIFLRAIGAIEIDLLESLKRQRDTDADYDELRRSTADNAVRYGKTRARSLSDFALDGGEIALARLGLDYGSDAAALKAAHKREALRCHPDRGGNQDEMACVNAAHALVKRFFDEIEK